MRKTNLSGLIILMFILTLAISSCGGGGGGGTTETPAPTQHTKAVVKLSTVGTPSAGPIGIVQARLNLPSGVSVKATDNVTDTGVITASGSAAAASGTPMETGVYSSGSVTVSIANTAGFDVGEFATVNCDIAAGSSPTSSDFSVTNFDVRDLDGNAISGLSLSFTATIN